MTEGRVHSWGPSRYAGMGNSERTCSVCGVTRDDQYDEPTCPGPGRVQSPDDCDAPLCNCGTNPCPGVRVRSFAGRVRSPQEIITEALQERLDAACPDFWPDLDYWAESAIEALAAAGYEITLARTSSEEK